MFDRIIDYSPDGAKVIVCKDCISVYTDEEKRQQLGKIITSAPKIEYPFFVHCFPKLTNEQYKDSTELNVLKWAIAPEWGVVVGTLTDYSYIEYPYCKMKVRRG
jgi:hypothetical protein